MSTEKTNHTPSAGALRAAQSIRVVYCDKAPSPSAIRLAAQTIDRESGLSELLEACKAAVVVLDRAWGAGATVELRAAIAKSERGAT